MKKTLLLCTLTSLLVSGMPAAYAHTAAPVDASANQKTKDTYNWLTHLPNRASDKVASGFFGGYSNNGFSTTQLEELKASTGQYPAIFGCDYGAGWATASDPTTLIDYSCNSMLKSYSSSGGLITLNAHYPSPGYSTGGNLNTKLTNFSDLTNPNTDTGRRWKSYLDKTAAGLLDLQNAGVTVLWRPFHEMNGDWFWWGNQDAAAFKAAWIDMYNYFTNTKGLHNLIWIYAPDFSRDNRTAYYPGNSYVDIVGLDAYDDNPESAVTGYDELVALGKPFALTEIGPDSQGSFDYTKWLNAIKTKFPKTVYFFAWNDGWAPHRNQNGSVLFNDSWIVNRGEVTLSSITEGGTTNPDPTPGTATTLHSFEGSTESWLGSNVTGGPWTTTEWKAGGSQSLKADVNLGASSKNYTLSRAAAQNLSSKSTLKATVNRASWGSGTITAKLYIKTGGTWQWYDGGAVTVPSSGTTLSLSLAGLANLSDVREIGVQFTASSGSSGTSAVYVDSVIVE